jgi:hypothetical protein
MAGLFEGIIDTLKEAKTEGKLQYGFRYNPDLKLSGGYYDDNKMFEVDVDRDGVNLMFRKKFVQGGTVTFDKAKKLAQGKNKGKYTIRVHKVGGAQGERVTFVGNKTQVKNFIKSHNKKVIDLATERASKLPFPNYKLDDLKKDLKAGKTLLEIATEIYQGDKEYYDKQPKQFYKTGNKKGVQISPVTIIRGYIDGKLEVSFLKPFQKLAERNQKADDAGLKKAKIAGERWIKNNAKKYKALPEGNFGLMRKDFYKFMEKNFPKYVKYSTGKDKGTIKGSPYIKKAGSLFRAKGEKITTSLTGVEKNQIRINNLIKQALDIPIQTNVPKDPEKITKNWQKYYDRIQQLLPEAQRKGYVPKFFINKQTKKKIPITAKNYMNYLTRTEPAVMKEIFDDRVKFSPEHASGIKRAAMLNDAKALGTIISQEYGERTNQKGVIQSANLLKGKYLDRNIDLNLRKALQEATTLDEKKAFVKKADNFAAKAEKEYGVKQARYSVGKDGKIKIKSPDVSLNDSLLSKTKNSIRTFIANDGLNRAVYKELPQKLKTGIKLIAEGKNADKILTSHLEDIYKDVKKVRKFTNSRGVRFLSFPAVPALEDVGIEVPESIKKSIAKVAKTMKPIAKAFGTAALVVDPMFAAMDASEAFTKGAGGKTAGKYVAQSFVQDLINLPTTVAGAGKFVSDYAKGKRGDDLKFEGDLLYTPKTFADENLQATLDSMSKAEKLRNIADLKFDQTGMTMVDDMEVPPSRAEVDAAREANRKSLMGPYYKYGIESMVEEEPEETPLQNQGIFSIFSQPKFKGVIET